jgi:hypothetical protein
MSNCSTRRSARARRAQASSVQPIHATSDMLMVTAIGANARTSYAQKPRSRRNRPGWIRRPVETRTRSGVCAAVTRRRPTVPSPEGGSEQHVGGVCAAGFATRRRSPGWPETRTLAPGAFADLVVLDDDRSPATGTACSASCRGALVDGIWRFRDLARDRGPRRRTSPARTVTPCASRCSSSASTYLRDVSNSSRIRATVASPSFARRASTRRTSSA